MKGNPFTFISLDVQHYSQTDKHTDSLSALTTLYISVRCVEPGGDFGRSNLIHTNSGLQQGGQSPPVQLTPHQRQWFTKPLIKSHLWGTSTSLDSDWPRWYMTMAAGTEQTITQKDEEGVVLWECGFLGQWRRKGRKRKRGTEWKREGRKSSNLSDEAEINTYLMQPDSKLTSAPFHPITAPHHPCHLPSS